jgi:hypothetical protein
MALRAAIRAFDNRVKKLMLGGPSENRTKALGDNTVGTARG